MWWKPGRLAGKIFCRWKRPGRREVENFMAWARERAVMIDPLNGTEPDIERLSFLDELIGSKRIVYLGEEDHWIDEKYHYRLLLLRYLFSRGWRHVGEELGWSDGLRIDRYLKTGDHSFLERVATYGFRGDLRADRSDSPTGILKQSWNAYPEREFASSQIRFAKALRSLSEGRPPGSDRLHFFGFDIDALTGGGYEDLAGLLARYRGAQEVQSLQALLERVPGESLDMEISRLTHALEIINCRQDRLTKLLGEKHYRQLHQWSLTLLDSLKFVRTANPATDWATLNRAMAAREEVMVRHVMNIWSQMTPDEKLVLMGHNRHLSKDAGSIHTKGSSPGSRQWLSMGTLLHRLLPGQVFSIWMLHDQGLSSQPYKWLSSEYTSIPGSLNSILAEVGPSFILPTAADPRAGLLGAEMKIAGIYNLVYRTTIARQADAIFFAQKVSPLKP